VLPRTSGGPCRLVEGGDRAFAFLLSRHPPAARFDRFRRITEIDDDVDVFFVARHAGGKVHVAAARIEIAMRSGPAGLVLAELFRIQRVAHVPDQHALVVRLIRIAAPAGRNHLERGDHAIAVHLHLNRPGVVRARDELGQARIRRIGDIDDAPAEMPQMSHVQIPALADLADGHLETRPLIEIAVADDLHVLAGAAGRNGIGKCDGGQGKQGRKRGSTRHTDEPHALLLGAHSRRALQRLQGWPGGGLPIYARRIFFE